MERMYSVDLSSLVTLGQLKRCPGCGADVAMTAGDESTFSCGRCGARWRVELGRVMRVGPASHGAG